jgi:hypothetical protein
VSEKITELFAGRRFVGADTAPVVVKLIVALVFEPKLFFATTRQ